MATRRPPERRRAPRGRRGAAAPPPTSAPPAGGTRPTAPPLARRLLIGGGAIVVRVPERLRAARLGAPGGHHRPAPGRPPRRGGDRRPALPHLLGPAEPDGQRDARLRRRPTCSTRPTWATASSPTGPRDLEEGTHTPRVHDRPALRALARAPRLDVHGRPDAADDRITGPTRPAVRGAPVTLSGSVNEASTVTVDDAPVKVASNGIVLGDVPEPARRPGVGARGRPGGQLAGHPHEHPGGRAHPARPHPRRAHDGDLVGDGLPARAGPGDAAQRPHQLDRARPEGRVGDRRLRLQDPARAARSAPCSRATTSHGRQADPLARRAGDRPRRRLPRPGPGPATPGTTASASRSSRRPPATRTPATAASRTSPTRWCASTTWTSPARRPRPAWTTSSTTTCAGRTARSRRWSSPA